MTSACLRSSLFLASLLFATSAVAQTQAFPSAQGAGAFARGDVEYEVYEVTNLNASGPGSLWDALGDNRIVVFRVSGIIDIPTNTTRSFRNLQVLGQTAPAPGVTIVASGWRWSGAQNAVFRYLRWRTWQCRDDLFDPCGVDNVDVAGLGETTNSNLIFDHCSFAFGGDEFLSFRGDAHTATVQNSLFSYGKTGMLAGDSSDYTQGYDFSILNNFWHTIGKRTPNPNSNGRIDVIGNVSYNILNLGMRTGGSLQLNEIGNHYIRAGTHRLSFGGGATPLVHTSGNRFGDVVTANGQDNSVMWEAWQDGRDPVPSDFRDAAFPFLNYTSAIPDGDDSLLAVQNRERGANAYLSDTGSPIRYLDALDEEAYAQFDDGEFFDWDDGTGNRTQAAWKVIPQRRWLEENEANFGVIVNEHDQSTHAGVVPHVWIEEQGLDADTFDPLGNDLDAAYTNIEVYSFGVDGEPGDVEPGDAGPGGTDAGPGNDAGPGSDAGLVVGDAGSADAGTPFLDGGAEIGEDAGCGCRASQKAPSPASWTAMLVLLGLVIRRRS